MCVALLIMTIVFPTAARGADNDPDGNALLRRCKAVVRMDNASAAHTGSSPIKDGAYAYLADASYCLGMMHGVQYMMYMWQVSAKQSKLDSYDLHGCIPDEVEADQEARIVIKYLEDNPAELHKHDVLLANAALKKAFPCKKR